LRVLFLTHRLPYAPNRGDRIRAYHLLRTLSSTDEVDVVSLVHDDEEANRIGEVESMATSVATLRVPRLRNMVKTGLSLASSRPATHSMLSAPGLPAVLRRVTTDRRPDVVLAYCSGIARVALEPPLQTIPFVLDMVDVDSAKWAALSETAAAPWSWVYARESRLLSRFEARAVGRAVRTLVVTERERQTLAEFVPDSRIAVVGNGVDVESFRPRAGPSSEPRVVFCGVMNYRPNEEAVIWFAKMVWPKIRAVRRDALFQVVGSHPTAAVKALAERANGVEVTGAVADVRSYLWRAAVSVAPLFTARGVQNKVLEAIAAGLPAVVTPVVASGLPSAVSTACSVAEGADAFAQQVIYWIGATPSERRRIAEQVDFRNLTWERTLAPVRPILLEAAQTHRRS
jgi:sugar transferase (PEP-CTERM/EpsH1 system associated)